MTSYYRMRSQQKLSPSQSTTTEQAEERDWTIPEEVDPSSGMDEEETCQQEPRRTYP